MNLYIREQIRSMMTVTGTFRGYCRSAALKDDGRIDKEEERTLKRIDRASDRFMKELEKIVEDSEKKPGKNKTEKRN